MATHSRLDTLAAIKRIGLVPLFYHADVGVAKAVVTACAEGGATIIEFTHRGDRAIEVFHRLAELRDRDMPSLILGAGSICNGPSAAMAISAGADFVVGPLLDEDVARVCNGQKVPYLPGCGSLTEIHKAHLLGVEICKVFPADSVGGPGFIKAVRGPCPWADLLPTGGVSPTLESLSEWFLAGAVAVGMGSNLISKEVVQKREYPVLVEKVRQTLQIIQQVRKPKV
ncbi:MAG: bifunctional 4-hydroxy-2-oxoglutarate aldolase/2-dehydro-3-deoxy-phosphogluconate aldolase [Phycisphaerae bacterium]|nr:bifunctional 4-hydroxy-2-oxoglutarate aldolase/2-dehydro-3-deoxy-phosphogluconate aldolase [Phycisphaerae bacterium]